MVESKIAESVAQGKGSDGQDEAGNEHTIWRIENLTPHPRQAELFRELPQVELRALADSIHRGGLDHPPEILPDGTLITGHRRVQACRLLGWVNIPVVVRHDLAGQAEGAVECRLIADNLDRRQLDIVERGRCCQRLLEIELKQGRKYLHPGQLPKLRARVGERLGIPGRTLNRYLQLLRSPVEIQNAVSSGALTLVEACRLDANRPVQDAIVEAIRAGRDPKKAAAELLKRSDRRHRNPWRALACFVASLRRGVEDLQGRTESIHSISTTDAAVLKKALRIIRQLLDNAGLKAPRSDTGWRPRRGKPVPRLRDQEE